MTRLTTEESKMRYDAWHAALPVDIQSDSHWHRLIRKHLDPARDLCGRRILEIGCGRGGFATWLAQLPLEQRPSTIVAADFSITAITKGQKFAASQNIESIIWKEADIQNIPYANESFDTVFSCETIEHVPYPRMALSELARVLKPGGRLFLTTPNYLNALGLYRVYLRLIGRRYSEGGQPINHFFTTPQIYQWIAQVGLSLTQFDALGYFLPIPGRPQLDMHLPEKLAFLTRWFAVHPCYIAAK